MGKNKRKAFGAKNKDGQKKTNPFDLKFTIQKRQIIGTAKSATGAPLVTKKKAFEQRKKTLGGELRNLGKKNQIKDRRIGQRNANLTVAEKAEKRFVAQRKQLFAKSNKYLLSDNKEDDLQHLSKKLTETEKFQRQGLNKEDDEIDDRLFTAAHFGGGNIVNTKRDKEGKKLTRKEMLEQIIQQSKEAKAIKSKERELQFETWKKLDEQFKEVRESGELQFGRVQEADDDDYMELYLKLQNDPKRAVALDPKKDPKLSAEYEAKRIEKAENERLNRMNEMDDNYIPHESVDDERKKAKKQKKVQFELIYDKDGKLKVDQENETLKPEKRVVKSADDDEMGYEFDSDNEYDQLIEGEDVDDEDLEDEEEEEEDEEGEDADSILDEEEADSEMEEEADEEVEEDAERKGKVKVPASEEQLEQVFDELPVTEWVSHFNQIIKENNPKKSDLNKAKLGKLCGWTIELFIKKSEQATKANETSKALTEIICNLAKNSPKECAERCRDIVGDLYSTLKAEKRSGQHHFFVLAFIRLIRTLFTVSDRVHSVCLPTMVIASDVVSKTRIYEPLDCAKVLLFVDELATWFEESKRYCPEVLNFLLGTLILASKSPAQFPNGGFPISEPYRSMLHINSKSKLKTIPPISINAVFSAADSAELNQSTRTLDLQTVRLAVRLTKFFAELYSGLTDVYAVLFRPFLKLVKELPVQNYPKVLTDEVKELEEILNCNVDKFSEVRQLTHAVSKKIKMIDMLEPRIEEHFNAKHPTHKRSDPKATEKRLTKKVKKETRSAIKDLRMDAKYLAGEQQRQLKEVSEERKEKTKRILASLQGQESEYQKRKKTKN
ncbi:unnamed protein product [Bursaphelenchus xylophilus]|uniref:(pine wood nematode) hypothetical protein n=1 Tax=Bursaphelenchus xylophilus TaxID=6326 RepID=A0A1I7S522_BURXY|nr:unnamed protein product [Bursaphelenchus xylophilus]CAG9117621.1 unnamed protein product [Bursaphelenchus xylophilus]